MNRIAKLTGIAVLLLWCACSFGNGSKASEVRCFDTGSGMKCVNLIADGLCGGDLDAGTSDGRPPVEEDARPPVDEDGGTQTPTDDTVSSESSSEPSDPDCPSSESEESISIPSESDDNSDSGDSESSRN